MTQYENPITTTEKIKELQEILVQTCINYVKQHNLTDVDEVNFSVDGLEENAINFGTWTPSMDSHISIVGLQEEDDRFWVDKKGKKHKFKVRKLIGEYC